MGMPVLGLTASSYDSQQEAGLDLTRNSSDATGVIDPRDAETGGCVARVVC